MVPFIEQSARFTESYANMDSGGARQGIPQWTVALIGHAKCRTRVESWRRVEALTSASIIAPRFENE